MQVENPGEAITSSHNISVTTTCPAGYNLSIQAGKNDKGVHDNNMYQNGSSASSSLISPATGTTSVPNTLGDNQWGFSLENPSTTNNKFSAVPTTLAKIKTTNTSTTSENTTIYYGAKTSPTLISGIYATTVLYSAMPNPDCYNYYNVTFNAGDGGSGSYPDRKVKNGDTINLAEISKSFSKPDYKLAQWKDQDGNTYDAGSTSIDVNPTLIKNVVLTAQWEDSNLFVAAYRAANKTTMIAPDDKQYYKMQDMTSGICNAVPTPSKGAIDVPEITLIDTRDNELYTVRKLADGNCWMVQNLRLVGPKNLTPADSNVDSDFTLPNTPNYEFSNFSPYIVEIAPVHSDYNSAYYTWAAATAGTGNYSITASGTNAPSSICPKGWRLPQSVGSKSYYNLISTVYGHTTGEQIVSSPLSFSYAGGYFNGVLQGSDSGFYWTSTVYSEYLAYILYFSSKEVGARESSERYGGYPMRCVVNFEQYNISFNKADGVGDTPDISVYMGDAINLAAVSAKVSKAGYKLVGWKDQDGRSYNTTGTSVDVNPGKKSKVTLIAQWESIKFFPSTLTTMQGMTASICNSVTTPNKSATTAVTSASDYTNPNTQVPQVTLKDTRDNNTYTVRKLADGNCWMTQNLRLVGSRTLTSADSDVSSNFTLPAASTSGFSTSNYHAVQVAPVNSSYGNGAYYTWAAATAGTGNASITAQNAEASSSICPKGWRLPQKVGNKSYYNLINTTYGRTTGREVESSPLSFAHAGGYFDSTFYDGGSYGFYWSSTAYSADSAYVLYFLTWDLYTMESSERCSGSSVRCVAR